MKKDFENKKAEILKEILCESGFVHKDEDATLFIEGDKAVCLVEEKERVKVNSPGGSLDIEAVIPGQKTKMTLWIEGRRAKLSLQALDGDKNPVGSEIIVQPVIREWSSLREFFEILYGISYVSGEEV